MTLRSGMRLGPYQIISPISAGGMGEVFKARDTRLERIVAIKVLPEAFARDELKRSRLQREAKVISQLDHPHICILHDTGSEEGIDFLVMEHLEGDLLADRLTKGALPFDQVMLIGIQIAEALDRAHQQNIVHRDLKPGNIMLTKSGVKVLDFGLAKFADDQDASLTADGAVVGTPRYMAPEQVDGRRSDHRADIFALGCVLYELRTGKPAVGGVQRVTPAELDYVIRKCLERDPDERWQNASDIAKQLRWIGETATGRQNRWRRSTWIAMTVLTLVTLLASFALVRQQRRPLRATFAKLTNAAGVEESPAISPDGTLLAYVSSASGNDDIYLQRIGGWKAVNLTADSKAPDRMPAFSPDGQLIAFRSERDGGGLFVMGATGESVRRVSDFGFNPVWSQDAKELAASSQPMAGPYVGTAPTGDLWRIEVATGRKRRIFRGDAFAPSWSPNGRRIAFCVSHKGDILSIPSEGGEASAVTSGSAKDWNPVWSRDGYIYFSSDRGGSTNLWRIAVDKETGTPRGEPEPLSTPALFSGPLAISADGKRVVYCARNPQSHLQRIAFDPLRGTVHGSSVEVSLGNIFVAMPDVSPDGQWIAFNTLFEQEDIYVIRSDGTDLRKLTDDRYTDTWPRWSPDGKRIAFASNRTGRTSRPASEGFQIWAVNADGSGLAQLTDVDPAAGGPPVWSPDGRRIVIRSKPCNHQPCFADIAASVPATMPAKLPVPLFQQGYQGRVEAWSPDGKWLVGIAWLRERVTDVRAWVYSIDTGESRFLPSLSGRSTWARWLSDSRRILLLDGHELYVVDRDGSRTHQVYSFAFDSAGLALPQDGRTIYILRASDEADIWLAELR